MYTKNTTQVLCSALNCSHATKSDFLLIHYMRISFCLAANTQTALAAHMQMHGSRWHLISKTTLILLLHMHDLIKGLNANLGFDASTLNLPVFAIKAVVLNTAMCTRSKYRKVDNIAANVVHTMYQRYNGHFLNKSFIKESFGTKFRAWFGWCHTIWAKAFIYFKFSALELVGHARVSVR